MRNCAGNFEAHIARPFEEAASNPTVGLSDRFVGALIDELRKKHLRWGVESLLVSTHHNF